MCNDEEYIIKEGEVTFNIVNYYIVNSYNKMFFTSDEPTLVSC